MYTGIDSILESAFVASSSVTWSESLGARTAYQAACFRASSHAVGSAAMPGVSKMARYDLHTST